MLVTRDGRTPEQLIDEIAGYNAEMNAIDPEAQKLSCEVERLHSEVVSKLVGEVREYADENRGVVAGDAIVMCLARERLYGNQDWLGANSRYAELQERRRDLAARLEAARWELMTLTIRSASSMLVPLDLLLASGQPS